MRRSQSTAYAFALILAACGPNNNGAASATGAGSTSGSGGASSSTGSGGGGPAQIGSTVRISLPGGDADHPTLAPDANGGWGLGYDQLIAQEGTVWFARIGADGKANPAPAQIAKGEDVAVRAGRTPGTFGIGWRAFDIGCTSGCDNRVYMALAPAGGPPGAATKAASIDGFNIKSFDIAEAPSGWVVAGCRYDGNEATVFVQSAGAMTPVATPNHCRVDGWPMRLAWDGSQLWLAWSEDVPQAQTRTNLQRVSAGGMDGPVIIVNDAGGVLVDVVVGPSEIAVVYYSDLLIHLARFDLTGKPKGAPVDLDPGGKGYQSALDNGSDVAFGAAGYADAFWDQPHGPWQPTLQARGPDGSNAGALVYIEELESASGEGEIALAPSGGTMGIAFTSLGADAHDIFFARAGGL